MALPTLILLSIEMAVGMPMLLLLEGWGTLDFNKFGCFFVSIFLVPRMVSENSPPRCGMASAKIFPSKNNNPEMWAFFTAEALPCN